MDSKTEMMEAIELLRWQLELGVDENIGNSPIDRFSEITLDLDPEKKKYGQRNLLIGIIIIFALVVLVSYG